MRRTKNVVQAAFTAAVVFSILLGLGPVAQAWPLGVPTDGEQRITASDVSIQCHWITQRIDCSQVHVSVNLETRRWYRFKVSGTFPDGATDTIWSGAYWNGSGSGWRDMSASFSHGHNPGTYGPHSAYVAIEIWSSNSENGYYSKFGSINPNPQYASATDLICGEPAQMLASSIGCVAPGQVQMDFVLNNAPAGVEYGTTELHFTVETPCGTEDLVAPLWKEAAGIVHYLYADYACADGGYRVTAGYVDLGVYGSISLSNVPFAATVSGCECYGSISGYKRDTAGTALAGFTVELYRWDEGTSGWVNTGLTQVTTAGGYAFSNIVVDRYKVVVVEDDPNYSGVITEQEVTLTCDNPDQTVPDFVNEECLGKIWGYKCIDERGLATVGYCATPHEGVTIQLTGHETAGGAVNETTATDAEGYYEFANLRPGLYDVTVLDVPGFKPDPAEYADINLSCGDEVGPYAFVNEPCSGSIAGVKTKRVDGQSSPHGGVTIRLTGTDVHNQSVELTALTDAVSGAYLFEGLAPGSYTISVEDMAGWTTSPSSYGVELSCDDDVTGKDFVNTYVPCDPANVVLQDANPAWGPWEYVGEGRERRERMLIYVDTLTGEFCSEEVEEEFRPYSECQAENLTPVPGDWSEWTYNAETGKEERTRTVSYYDVNSGAFCHDETETEERPYDECQPGNLTPVVGVWSDWAYNPDTGLMERTRTVSYYDVNSGAFCHDEVETESLPYGECLPENQRREEGEWSDWIYNADTGLMERTRTVSYYDINTGTLCDIGDETEELPYGECQPENLRREDGEWSDWTYNPDTGLLERTRTVSYYDINTGTLCDVQDETEEEPYVECESENLRVDEGEWSEWQYNPDTGMMERSRLVSYYDVNTGTLCDVSQGREEEPYVECQPENQRREEGEWSEWTYNPETDMMERTRDIFYYDVNTETLCDSEEEVEQEPYYRECPSFSLDELNCNDLTVTGSLGEFVADSVTVEWGDGESDTYYEGGAVAHTYADYGAYTIDVYIDIADYQELCDPVVVDLQPFEAGSLTIEKVWEGEPSEQSVDFEVTGPNDYNSTVTLTGDDSETLTGLAAGEYRVEEQVPEGADWEPASDTVQSALIDCGQTEDSVTFVNSYSPPPPPVEYEVSIDQSVDCYGFVVTGQAHDGAMLKVTVVEEGDDPETYATEVSGTFSESFAREDPSKDGRIDLTAELWTLDEEIQYTEDNLVVTLSQCQPVVPPIHPPTKTTERDLPSHHQILIFGQYAGDPHDAHDALHGAGGAGTVTEREVRKMNSGIIPGSNLVHALSDEEQTVEVVLLTFDETSPDVTKYLSPVITGLYPVSYYHFQDIAKGRIIGDLPRTGIFLVRIGRSVAVFAASEPGVDKDVDGKSDPRMIDFSFVRYQNGILKPFIDVPGSNAYKDPNMQKLANAYAWAVQRELVRLGYSVVDNDLAGSYLVPHGIESLWEDPNMGRVPGLYSMMSLIKGQPLLVGEAYGGLPAFMQRGEDGSFVDARLNANAFRTSLPSDLWGAGSLIPLQIDAEKPADFGRFVVDRYFIFTR